MPSSRCAILAGAVDPRFAAVGVATRNLRDISGLAANTVDVFYKSDAIQRFLELTPDARKAAYLDRLREAGIYTRPVRAAMSAPAE